jgi:hypothetical protein
MQVTTVVLAREMLVCSAAFQGGIFLPAAPVEAYNTAMAKTPAPTVEVTCPCCRSKLVVDPQFAAVLSHTPPPRVAPDVDIADAARILSEQAQRREDKFRDSWEAERTKEDVLTRKFEEALKKAKDQPVEKPLRDFDLE